MRPESGLGIAPNLPQIGKLTVASQFVDMKLSPIFFWHYFVSLVKFSYWSKFHVNIIHGSGVMAICFCKGFTRNSEIRNTRFWFLPNIWGLGQARDTRLGTDVSNEMLLNSAKCQGYSFYRFLVVKEDFSWGGGRGGGKTTPPTHNIFWNSQKS